MIVQPATFDSEARFWWKSGGSGLRTHMELEETTPNWHHKLYRNMQEPSWQIYAITEMAAKAVSNAFPCVAQLASCDLAH